MRERVLGGLLTTNDVAVMFGRSKQTVTIWRTRHGLPYIRIPGEKRDSIRFDPRRTREWAEKHGKKQVVK